MKMNSSHLRILRTTYSILVRVATEVEKSMYQFYQLFDLAVGVHLLQLVVYFHPNDLEPKARQPNDVWLWWGYLDLIFF